MRISIEEKKAEAVARMKLLQLDPELISRFEAGQEIACFEGSLGFTSSLEAEDVKQIRLLEADSNILVYAVHIGNFNIGTLTTCLYVSDYQEEWDDDHQNIMRSKTSGMAAYVFNCTYPELSEFGYVGIDHTVLGGLKRTW